MSSSSSVNSLPFFSHPGSSSDLVDGPEKTFTSLNSPQTPIRAQHARGRFEMRKFLLHLMGWPAIVIIGQVMLQLFAWGFFTVVEIRGFIALPPSSAEWARNHTHPVTLISTVISTCLASCSSFLFSWGLRHSLALYMHRDGMSLSTFVSSLKVSTRSFVFDPRKAKWSATSIALVILTGLQTTGWTTLLTPLPITIPTPLTGSEISLSSPALLQMQTSGQLDNCVYNGTSFPAFTVGQTESGYALVKNRMSFPASITLMDQTFNISTAGVLPLSEYEINASSWFGGNTSIPAALDRTHLPKGLESSYTLMQQGFTAYVDCHFQEITADTTPSGTLWTDTVKDWSSGQQSVANITFSQFTSDCVVPQSALNNTYAYTDSQDSNYVLAIACMGDANYTLMFKSAGKYDFMNDMVCHIAPQITTVNVKYGDIESAGTIGTDALDQAVAEPVGRPAGLSAITTILNTVFFSQAISTNIMGDELDSAIAESDGLDYQDETILAYTEVYLSAVAEYSGSVLRACLSATNMAFADGVPANITVPIDGLYSTQTVGWLHASATTFWVQVPGTLVALITIFVVLAAVAQYYGDSIDESFDPSNAMHLLAASAAGGLHDVFHGTEEKDIQAVEDVNIVLSSLPGRGPALVRNTV
ncbi:hypothetical protein MVEN_00710300 [Mycena venus]|uniref:Uncharacterized protein n=1 Tax=Mycena venus TaxID=2733690 RepID=A0A8H6YIY0_9AGAR|nr:hypothetical protein MVEN_00710300 [Mycena venus]